MTTKKILSLFLVFSLLLSLPLLFAGCVADGKDGETYRLIPTLQEEAVAPVKKTYSDEEQAILDEYYQKMLIEFPSWRQIPRKMVREFYYEEDDGYFVVDFVFCLGGINTDCRCRFSSSRINPEGKWSIYEDGFKKFYTSGVTQAQMDYLRERLALQIEEKIEQQGLIEREPVRESIHPCWYDYSGELCVTSEYIAYYPDPPEGINGCGIDHEHLIARIILE